MKIAVDIHGTIDWDPVFWRKAIELFLALGHQVYIISGPEEDKIKERLEKLGVDYRDLYIESVVDYLKEKDVHHWYKNDNFWTTEEVWWEAKAEICKMQDIDVIIDDHYEYFHREIMPDTRFVLYQKGRFV